jgi:hypothetical protein
MDANTTHQHWTETGKISSVKSILRIIGSIPSDLAAGTSYEKRLKPRRIRVETSDMGLLAFKWYNIKSTLHRRRLLKTYTTLSISSTLDAPYLYAPLHYQPERLTLPEGGVYDDQLLFVQLLAETVPDDWRILVKEHPRQLRAQDSHQGRSSDLYEDLVAIPGVELVDIGMSTLELIDQSLAVATVTGTAGWEAVVRGTPAIAFGTAWYAPVEGVYDVRNRQEVADAITQLHQHTDVSSGDVTRFVHAFDEVGFRGYIYPYRAPDGMSDATNAANMFECLTQLLPAETDTTVPT